MCKGLYLAVYLHRIYTMLSVLVSVNTRDLVSCCALLSGWVSCLMLGQLLYCGLRIYHVIWAHASLALCPNCPWCMWCYMRLPIAFWDNQQISLADSTLPLNWNRLIGTYLQVHVPVCNFGSCVRPIRDLNFSTLMTGNGLVNKSAGFSSPVMW